MLEDQSPLESLPWYKDIQQRLGARDAAQRDPYVGIMKDYLELHGRLAAATSPDEHASGSSSSLIEALKEKVRELGASLELSRRKNDELSEERLRVLEDQNKILRAENARLHELAPQLETVRSENAALREQAQQMARRAADFDEILREKDRVLGKLHDELTTLSLEAHQRA